LIDNKFIVLLADNW